MQVSNFVPTGILYLGSTVYTEQVVEVLTLEFLSNLPCVQAAPCPLQSFLVQQQISPGARRRGDVPLGTM